MKTFTHEYTSKEVLARFIKDNYISNYNGDILIQVFTSMNNKEYILYLKDELLQFIPNAKIIGTTTNGEIVIYLRRFITNSYKDKFKALRRSDVQSLYDIVELTSTEAKRKFIEKSRDKNFVGGLNLCQAKNFHDTIKALSKARNDQNHCRYKGFKTDGLEGIMKGLLDNTDEEFRHDTKAALDCLKKRIETSPQKKSTNE